MTNPSLSSDIHDFLPDLCSVLYDLDSTVQFDSLPALKQAKILTDVTLDFGTFPAGSDPEALRAVVYVAALRYTGVIR